MLKYTLITDAYLNMLVGKNTQGLTCMALSRPYYLIKALIRLAYESLGSPPRGAGVLIRSHIPQTVLGLNGPFKGLTSVSVYACVCVCVCVRAEQGRTKQTQHDYLCLKTILGGLWDPAMAPIPPTL